jgi:ubiquinone/menaquinone biosynthesis C-methylase UbiE
MVVSTGAGPGRVGRDYDDARLVTAYEWGNEMPEDSLRAWVELIASHMPRPRPSIIEVGAGTGIFSAAMARWLEGSRVLAVDASEAMLAEAQRHHAHPRVRYVAGAAEAVPASAATFDLAFLSRVIHHIDDRTAAARELARVLRVGGKVIVRTTFRERLDAVVYEYWPRLRSVDQRRFPGEQDVIDDFVAAGFALESVTSFTQPVTASLRDFRARLVTRPQSKFNYLSAEQFQEGLSRLAAAARSEPLDNATPVYERYDVAVFARQALRVGGHSNEQPVDALLDQDLERPS